MKILIPILLSLLLVGCREEEPAQQDMNIVIQGWQDTNPVPSLSDILGTNEVAKSTFDPEIDAIPYQTNPHQTNVTHRTNWIWYDTPTRARTDFLVETRCTNCFNIGVSIHQVGKVVNLQGMKCYQCFLTNTLSTTGRDLSGF